MKKEFITKNKKKNPTAFDFFGSDDYRDTKKSLYDLLNNTDIDGIRKLDNLALFFDPKYLSRILFFNEIYKKILDVPGYIIELGCQYGSSSATFQSLRDIYEPFNRTRKIFSFDTFTGLKGVTKKDSNLKGGEFSTIKNYEKTLEEILTLKENFSALPHYNRMGIYKGDVNVTFDKFTKDNPEALLSLVFFDMDIYKPTTQILKKMQKFITKGTVIVFDEICDELSPGETLAFREIIGSKNVRLKRWQYNSRLSYYIVE
tara:strand:+ start:1775 stop:2551 length:777 start_codon:yes stop_codon:yes gene_type:complete